jgi:hypothetical protein
MESIPNSDCTTLQDSDSDIVSFYTDKSFADFGMKNESLSAWALGILLSVRPPSVPSDFPARPNRPCQCTHPLASKPSEYPVFGCLRLISVFFSYLCLEHDTKCLPGFICSFIPWYFLESDYSTEYGNRDSVQHSDVAPSQYCSIPARYDQLSMQRFCSQSMFRSIFKSQFIIRTI